MKKEIVIVLLVIVFLSSCATILTGTKATITITSPNTNKANLKVDGMTYANMILPAQIEVKRGRRSSLVEAENEEMEGSVAINKSFNNKSLWNLALLGPGLIGWIVDLSDGAYMKPDKDTYSILMTPKQNNSKAPFSGEIVNNNQQHFQRPIQQSNNNYNQSETTSRHFVDVDVNIPQSKTTVDNTFVLIIANEDYLFLDKVSYAKRDGEIFKEYCIKTLGVPEEQVRYCSNASYGIISGNVDWLRYALENFEDSRGIVYYCGHGIPDEKTSAAYIIPIDGKGTNMATCVSLNELYKTLAATNATRITYFMDACFTGANKEGSMLVAARGVAIKPKSGKLEGNTIVFSASSGDETAMTYEEKQHGLFTYYLLKKLQETAGDVSYEELANYISKKVKKDAFLLNEKPQTPVVATSPALSSSWKNMRMK